MISFTNIPLLMIYITLIIVLSFIPIFVSSTSNVITSNPYLYDIPPIYWINLDNNIKRANYMKNQFELYNLTSIQSRISAYHYSEDKSKQFIQLLAKLEKPCRRNTYKDIAVILSHLKAIHHAIYFPLPYPNPSDNSWNHDNERMSGRTTLQDRLYSDYALIMEDDVKWLYHINFTALIDSTIFPSNASIIQLITSNTEAIKQLFTQYHHQDTTTYTHLTSWQDVSKGGKHALYWSAQAYLIHLPSIKPFIDDVINMNSKTNVIESFKIINSFFPKKCKRSKNYPCVLCNCLFADTYIYAGGGPTYVMTIPLFNGGKIGYESEIHQNQVPVHRPAFQMIHDIFNMMSYQSSHHEDVNDVNNHHHHHHTHLQQRRESLGYDPNRHQLPSFLIPIHSRNKHEYN